MKGIDPTAYFRSVRAGERKWAHRVGMISILWERLHFNLTIAMGCLGKAQPNPHVIKRIGNARTDGQKRKFMREAISQAKLRTEVHDELMWMLERLDKLTDLRNGFVHQVAMIGSDGTTPKLHLDPLFLLDRYREVKRDPEGAYKVLRTD